MRKISAEAARGPAPARAAWPGCGWCQVRSQRAGWVGRGVWIPGERERDTHTMEWAGSRSGTRGPGRRLPGVRAAPGSLRAAWPARLDPTPTAPGSRGTPCPEAGSRAAGEMGLHGCGGASQVPTARGAQTKATPARSSGPQGLQTQDWVRQTGIPGQAGGTATPGEAGQYGPKEEGASVWPAGGGRGFR